MTAPIAIPPRRWAAIKGLCPICGHNGGWCTLAPDGLAILCRRVESKRPIRQRDGSTAWLHPLPAAPLPPVKPKDKPHVTPAEWALRQRQNLTAADPQRREAFAAGLGLSVRSLARYEVGFDAEYGCWSFPMYDCDSAGKRTICGLHLRRWPVDPKRTNKFCVPGSRLGLFVPDDYDLPALEHLPEEILAEANSLLMLVLLPEGVSDCCAARDMGFMAVGRPSCGGGVSQVVRLLSSGAKRDVVAIADHDATQHLPDGSAKWPGLEGAIALCRAILPSCASLRFAFPPANTKDLRSWLLAAHGGTVAAADVLNLCLRTASVVSPGWLAAAERRIEAKKREERTCPASAN